MAWEVWRLGRSRKATDQSGDLRMENPECVKKGGQGPGQSGRRTDGSEDYVEGGGTQERADGTGEERKFPEDGKGDKGERKTAPRVRQKEDRCRPGLCRSAKGSSQEERGRRRTRTRSEIEANGTVEKYPATGAA